MFFSHGKNQQILVFWKHNIAVNINRKEQRIKGKRKKKEKKKEKRKEKGEKEQNELLHVW